MSTTDEAFPEARFPRSRALSTILWIGLVAGTLDITDNLIFNLLRNITPKMVFHYIASGLIGMASYRLGAASVILGIFLHYFIALSWTAIFYAASRKLSILGRRPVISGLIYGCIVYLFMNLVVVPLSRVPHAPSAMTVASRVNGVLAVLIFIGLTISLLTRRSAGPV